MSYYRQSPRHVIKCYFHKENALIFWGACLDLRPCLIITLSFWPLMCPMQCRLLRGIAEMPFLNGSMHAHQYNTWTIWSSSLYVASPGWLQSRLVYVSHMVVCLVCIGWGKMRNEDSNGFLDSLPPPLDAVTLSHYNPCCDKVHARDMGYLNPPGTAESSLNIYFCTIIMCHNRFHAQIRVIWK